MGNKMEEGRREEQLDVRVIDFFKNKAVRGYLMLSIPDVAAGLKVDRRKIETTLALLSKGKDPKLSEVIKGRVKYYILKELIEFCQNTWGKGR
jgi:hypothetical protein